MSGRADSGTGPSRGPHRDSRYGPMQVAVQAAVCAVTTTRLLLRRQLHLRASRIGTDVRLPNGRVFIVFR
jgi:hypothetical protein